MTTTKTQRIVRLERKFNSPSGNPKYRVHFADGSSAVTATDADVACGLGNSENMNTDVTVTYDSRGKITNVQPVK